MLFVPQADSYRHDSCSIVGTTKVRPTPLWWGERAKVAGQENCFSSAHQASGGLPKALPLGDGVMLKDRLK